VRLAIEADDVQFPSLLIEELRSQLAHTLIGYRISKITQVENLFAG